MNMETRQERIRRQNREGVKRWRMKAKARLVAFMGGKCALCGYERCYDALELHHLDKALKKFSFAGFRACPRKWEVIFEEAKKCILLCANCHREVEVGLRTSGECLNLVQGATVTRVIIGSNPISPAT